MSIKRLFAAGFFSLALAVSGLGTYNVASAVSGPTLNEAVAENSGGTSAKEAGDKVVLGFSEETNKFEVTEDNIDDIFDLSGGHSFLDGEGEVDDIYWNNAGDELIIKLSGALPLATVQPGDTVTLRGGDIKDEDDNAFSGTTEVTGSFGSEEDEDCDEDDDDCEEDEDECDEDEDDECDEDEDEEEDDEDEDCDEITASTRGDDDEEDEDDDCRQGQDRLQCNNALMNGKLYKVGSAPTVYLAVRHCILKPFRGAAVFKARGHKFQDIIQLSSLPAGVKISGEPALPVEGTLIKGSGKTVYFIGHNGKRRGFVSADVFLRLGFKFEAVQEISDSDLNELPTDTSNVSDDARHPDGSLIKCSNSPAVFLIVGGKRKPFASAEIFQGRGHSFTHILLVDCGRFSYAEDAPVTDQTE